MSDTGRIQKPAATPAEAGPADGETGYVPRAPRDSTPAGRFARIGEERANAAAQIQRSLKVWRKAAGADDAPAEPESAAEKEPGAAEEAAAVQEEAPEIGAKLEGAGLKVHRMPGAAAPNIRETPAVISLGKKSGKEKADDIPSWAAGCKMNPGETPVQAADRVMRQRFPNGDFPRGPATEHNKIKKYFERSG